MRMNTKGKKRNERNSGRERDNARAETEKRRNERKIKRKRMFLAPLMMKI